MKSVSRLRPLLIRGLLQHHRLHQRALVPLRTLDRLGSITDSATYRQTMSSSEAAARPEEAAAPAPGSGSEKAEPPTPAPAPPKALTPDEFREYNRLAEQMDAFV